MEIRSEAQNLPEDSPSFISGDEDFAGIDRSHGGLEFWCLDCDLLFMLFQSTYFGLANDMRKKYTG